MVRGRIPLLNTPCSYLLLYPCNMNPKKSTFCNIHTAFSKKNRGLSSRLTPLLNGELGTMCILALKRLRSSKEFSRNPKCVFLPR
ncbi:hypothetical protein FKM82_011511 [Ascaphus truei]